MNYMLTIDASLIDWSRAQFALTAIYHWLFVPLTLGLAVIMGIIETIYYRTGKPFWQEASKFWQRLFGVNFAMGVATGIILEFEFGTNWSNYSWFVGDIFGAPLAIEGIVAFFMESTFVAVMFFGWQKVSRGFHLASTWLTGIGATISAWWILVANSWMQYPIGCEFNPDTVRNEMTSFIDVALSPMAVDKFFHTVISSWIVGAVFVCAVSCWYLLRSREFELSRQSIKIASIVGIVASILAMYTGHSSAVKVAEVQPMKLAAMEGLYNGGNSASLTMVAAINPLRQPDYTKGKEPPLRIAIPNGLSVLATNTLDGYVPGINDILNGYTRADGTKELSAEEKIQRGRKAITTLAEYRKLKAFNDNDKRLPVLAEELKKDMPYFGYGYIKDRAELVPYIPINFYAFRIMVGIGSLLLLFFLIIGHVAWRQDITKRGRWLWISALVMLPLVYLASEAGWIVAELGRQPWAIQDMLPTVAAISDISSGSVALTFFIFLVLFSVLLFAEIRIMCHVIKNYKPQIEQAD